MSELNYEISICKSLEFDDDGNAICCGEASNENEDLEGDITLQQALLDSKEHFITNGVVTYDHRHNNPDEKNPERYIIGEPMDVNFMPDGKTLVKFKLFKRNDIAKEIIKKLQDKAKTVRISIGGYFGRKLGNKIISFLWDEIALTYKPVNNTLSPVYLGNNLSLSKSLKVFNAFHSMMSNGMTYDKIKSIIKEQKMAEKEQDEVLSLLNKVNKSFSDEEISATPDEEEGDLSLEEPVEKSEDGTDGDMEEPLEDEEDTDFALAKSATKDLYARLAVVEKSLAEMKERSGKVEKATSLAIDNIAKSLRKPVARQSVISKSIAEVKTKKPSMTKEEVIQKSMQAVKDGKISIYEFAELETGVQRGIPVSEDILKKLN